MSPDNIVSVTVTKQTASVSRAGFGTPLIMSYEAKALAAFTGIYAKEYTSVAEMITDLFDDEGVAVTMATAILGQNPKPSRIIVGKRTAAPTMIEQVTVNGSALNSTAYAISINGTAFTYTSDTASSIQEIVEGLAALVNAGSEPVTATEDNTILTLTADVAGTLFTLEINTALLKRKNTTADPGIVTDLTTVRTDPSGNDDWYCVLLDSQGEAEIEALAAHIETLPRIFMAASGDSGIALVGTTDDVASDLQDSAYDRTALIFHPNPHERPDCAWAGKCLPLDPGSETWKFKTLAGVPVVTLSPTLRSGVVTKSANVYELVAGNNMTAEGVMASGEFIDITRFIDFIVARMKENIFFALKNADKIPFTDAGVGIIENEIRGVLTLGISKKGFKSDPAPTVTVPLVADVSDSDRADRLLPDIAFSAALAGAIHNTVIAGVVSV